MHKPIRKRFSISEDTFVVGCIARLSPEKGIDVLLDAARLTPEMTHLIAGDGPANAPFWPRCWPPNAHLLGRVADTRALLCAIDALAIPSRREGQGIVALESMAAGVPIVASRVGGLAEMLKDEETALVVPPDNAEALAVALTRLQNEPELRLRLVADAKRLVCKKYDLRQRVRDIETVYEEL